MNLAFGLIFFYAAHRLAPNVDTWWEFVIIALLALLAFLNLAMWGDIVFRAAKGKINKPTASIEAGKPFTDRDGREWFVVEVTHRFGKGSMATIQDAKSYKRDRTII